MVVALVDIGDDVLQDLVPTAKRGDTEGQWQNVGALGASGVAASYLPAVIDRAPVCSSRPQGLGQHQFQYSTVSGGILGTIDDALDRQ